MPDSKITALTSISTSTDPANDPLVIVDVSDTSMAATGTTKKVTLNQLLATSPTATLASATITGDLTVDTNTLKVDSANNRVGIGTASPTAKFQLAITGSASAITRVNSFGNDGTFGFPSLATNSTGAFFGMGVDQNSPSAGFGFFREATGWNTALAFYTNNQTGGPNVDTITERYRIDSSGIATWSNVGGVAGTAMTLNSTGLGVGTSSIVNAAAGRGNVTIGGSSSAILNLSIGAVDTGYVIHDGTSIYLVNRIAAGSLIFSTNSTERLRIDSSGNVGIGVTPSAWGGGIKGLQIGSLGGSSIIGYSNACEIGSNFYFDTGYKYGATAASSQIQFTNGEIRFKNAASGTAGNAITYSQPMTLDGSGNLILQPPSSPPTLGTNGQLTVNATSNTNLRFSYRGSDGVTRVANITLA